MIPVTITEKLQKLLADNEITNQAEYVAFAENNADTVDSLMIEIFDEHSLWATESGNQDQGELEVEEEEKEEDEDAEN